MQTMLLLLFFVPALHAEAPIWLESPAQAEKASKSSGKPILVDLYAPWCYSCYYMKSMSSPRKPSRRRPSGWCS